MTSTTELQSYSNLYFYSFSKIFLLNESVHMPIGVIGIEFAGEIRVHDTYTTATLVHSRHKILLRSHC